MYVIPSPQGFIRGETRYQRYPLPQNGLSISFFKHLLGYHSALIALSALQYYYIYKFLRTFHANR